MSRQLLSKYGITEEDYQEMFRSQGGRCAICNVSAASLRKRLCVEHSHTSGKIRGLCCLRCNSLLGYAEDNPAILSWAIDYLNRNA